MIPVINIVKCKPTYAIYEAIYDHVRRAAHSEFGSRRPKYTLDEKGDIVYQGLFDEFAIVPVEMIKEFKKSRVLRRIINKRKPINRHDIDLFVRIIAKSRDLLEELYPGIKFHLLFWRRFFPDTVNVSLTSPKLRLLLFEHLTSPEFL